MLKKITVLYLIGYSAIVCAQQNTPFVADANGHPLISFAGNYISNGSPFISEEYYPAEITFQNNKIHGDTKALFNITDNQILLTDDAGNELAVCTPIKSMSIMKPASRKILLDGQAASITYKETRGHGKSGTTRTYKNQESFFTAFTGRALQKAEQNKNAVAALFADKQQQIATYIKEKKFRFKTESDLINVFE